MSKENSIEFHKIDIHKRYGKVINDVYLILNNGRCNVLSALQSLEEKDRSDIIDIISRMATNDNFRSPKIRHKLTSYSYGEIKPKGHRIFYFKKYGNNIILFDYRIKKKNSLGDKVYKQLEREKKYYEHEFEKFIK